MQNPVISVVVICYNQEQTIGRTLDSILAQKTDFPFEIIIGEDASPNDNTRAVCENYAARYPNIIRLLDKTENKGLLKNYADCLYVSRGQYIATCTGDDWWHNPDKLQLQVSYLEANPDYGVVHTDADIYNTTNQQTFSFQYPRNCPEGNVSEKMFKINFIYAISVLFRRDLLQYANFEEWINLGFVAEDHAMWLAFAPHTFFHYIPISTITYSSSPESASRSESLDKRLKFIKGICRIQLYFYEIQKPKSPSYQSLLSFQKKWLIHEILVKKDYSKLKVYKASFIIRRIPFIYYISTRLLLKIKTLFMFFTKGKKSVDFM